MLRFIALLIYITKNLTKLIIIPFKLIYKFIKFLVRKFNKNKNKET